MNTVVFALVARQKPVKVAAGRKDCAICSLLIGQNAGTASLAVAVLVSLQLVTGQQESWLSPTLLHINPFDP